jgi:hydroxyacylglutathione hydrolase
MRELAPGVFRLKQFPAPAFNVYLAEDILIDAGGRWDRWRILREIGRQEISLLALTHVHPDHQGSAKAVCEQLDIPLACHVDDVAAMEGRRPIQEAHQTHLVNRLSRRLFAGPPHQVGRVLEDGDEVAGFRVVHTPGHARGHVMFFRESDRVAICGDVIRNISWATLLPGIKEPPHVFTYDPEENRRSIRILADLEPMLILPGHGPAISDIEAFERFVSQLPA